LGMMDKDGFIYLKGRKKTMFLNANGQNIYPEEIESKLNALDGVEESLIVERKGKLVALVFPEDKTKTWTKEAILAAMQENLHKLNKLIPNYSQVSDIEIKEDPFEKTPKKSIKRFLYN
ncbi:MAG: long-chain fatty acid--CoA ligase, partial [Paludibacteraceae bacterium]|nr:long-chain fatty acid--CoA ligase [Paludibacteraceae bacterium]